MKMTIPNSIARTPIVVCLLLGAIGALPGAVLDCTPTQRATAKTAADIAGEACQFAFGEHPEELPPGVSLKDFCEVEENLLPFVDKILSAREQVAARIGTVRTRVLRSDAGTD